MNFSTLKKIHLGNFPTVSNFSLCRVTFSLSDHECATRTGLNWFLEPVSTSFHIWACSRHTRGKNSFSIFWGISHDSPHFSITSFFSVKHKIKKIGENRQCRKKRENWLFSGKMPRRSKVIFCLVLFYSDFGILIFKFTIFWQFLEKLVWVWGLKSVEKWPFIVRAANFRPIFGTFRPKIIRKNY